MRASLFMLLTFILLGLFFWLTLGGALFYFSVLLLIGCAILAIGYADTAILFFLGAREVRSSDEPMFFEAASQEAYKLAVPLPKLYIYNGSLERGFVLQDRDTISIVLNRSLLRHAHSSELSAICFELLLQVKKGMAPRRTRAMFLLGSNVWMLHGSVNIITTIFPLKEVRYAVSWFVNYLLHPWLDFLFRLILGTGYFMRLRTYLAEYPIESELIQKFGLKLNRPLEPYSLPSKKLIVLGSSVRSRHFQNILALELLPHEWDYFFTAQELTSAKEV